MIVYHDHSFSTNKECMCIRGMWYGNPRHIPLLLSSDASSERLP
jgi:hypothetical protein